MFLGVVGSLVIDEQPNNLSCHFDWVSNFLAKFKTSFSEKSKTII